MPVREGRAKLWFKTKEEQDEFDDTMISNMELTTDNEHDENYSLMFVRKKKEAFLTPNSKAFQEVGQQWAAVSKDPVQYINKYFAGKRDHTINRHWNIQKGLIAWSVGYLLLRELPIRSFYARSWIMVFAFAMYAERHGSINPFRPYYELVKDEFTDKDIRNYQAYTDMTHHIIPTANNKISEAKLWQLNQPAYLRECPEAKLSELTWLVAAPTPKTVAWDGTFNMPLEGLAHPLHKDAKFIDFAWWEY